MSTSSNCLSREIVWLQTHEQESNVEGRGHSQTKFSALGDMQ